jgi:hypothetical protein
MFIELTVLEAKSPNSIRPVLVRAFQLHHIMVGGIKMEHGQESENTR